MTLLLPATFPFGFVICARRILGPGMSLYNAANELTQASGGMSMTYSYHGNGDLVSRSDNTQVNVNTAGQIASITPPGQAAQNMTYRGIGELQRVGAGSNTYQYDGSGLSNQTAGGSSTYFTTLPGGGVISESVGGNTYYYLTDGAGNVVGLDQNGSAVNQYSYDPLGNVVSSSGNAPNPLTFQGGMFDSSNGFYYTGSGYYDPATGQAFGCVRDKGRYDPGEDNCGEDADRQCGGECSSGSLQPKFASSPSRLPRNNPNRFRRDWGSPRLCNDLHCTQPEQIIIGQYEDRTWNPRAENGATVNCGSLPNQHAFGLGQLLDCQRQTYLGTRYMWTTDPLYQLYAMRQYIKDRYGPGVAGEWAAVAHEKTDNGRGGY